MLSWMSVRSETGQEGAAFNGGAIRACFFYSALGLKGEPDKARGLLPELNRDQLGRNRCRVTGGVVQRTGLGDTGRSKNDVDPPLERIC